MSVERLPQDRAVSGDPWPDLSPYTKSVVEYAALYDRYLGALDSPTSTEDGLGYGARSEALWGLIARGASGVPFALDILRRGRAESREDGRALIAAYRSDPRVAAAIADALDVETAPETRRKWIECLSAVRDPAGLPSLARILRDASADATERELAARAVAATFVRKPPGGDAGIATAIEWIAKREAAPARPPRAPRRPKPTPRPGRVVFGGGLAPLGWTVGFIDRPLEECLGRELAWKKDIDHPLRAFRVDEGTIVERLGRLLPFDEPRKELLVSIDAGWTACFENGKDGGSVAGWAEVISERIGARAVVATHVPVGQYPYPATQISVHLPKRADEAKRPVRLVECGVFDSGRWEFTTWGSPLPFEEPEAYEAKRKRERFTRDMLLRYLAALGLHPDDPDAYGPAVLLEYQFDRPNPRPVTLDENRRSLGWT